MSRTLRALKEVQEKSKCRYKRMEFQKGEFKYPDKRIYWLCLENSKEANMPRAQCARVRVLEDGERHWSQNEVYVGL